MARYTSNDMTKPRTSAGQVLAESASDLKIE